MTSNIVKNNYYTLSKDHPACDLCGANVGVSSFENDFCRFRFEGCWPTLAKDTIGVVLVFDPEDANQDKAMEAL